MQGSDISRDENRSRPSAIERRRSRAETRRTLTVVQSPGTQERLESIFRAAPIGIGLLSGRVFLEVNDRFCQLTGYTREEVIGQSSRMLYMTQDDYDHVGTVKYTQIAQTGIGSVEARWKRKDGRIIDVLLNSSVIDRTDPSKCITLTALDITERKQAEEELRESEEKYRTLVEKANEAIGIAQDGVYVFANDRLHDLVGVPIGTLAGKPFIDFVWPEDREMVMARYRKRVAGETVEDAYDFRIIGAGGRLSWVFLSAAVVQWKGRPATINLITDITNRKRMEEALRESEARFRRLADATFEAVALHKGGVLLIANDQYFKMFGYTPDELLGKQALPLTVAPEARAHLIEQMESGCLEPYESIGLRKDGTHFPMEIRIREAEHKGQRIRVAAIRDVTERKRTEEELLAKEKEYRQLFDASPDGIILIGSDGRIVRANIAMARMYRFDSPDDLIGFYPPNFVAPSSREHSAQVLRRRLTGEEIKQVVEYELVRKDGTTFYGETLATLLRNEDGTVTGYICITRDTTERRRAEEALRKSEERYRLLFDEMLSGMAFHEIVCDASGLPVDYRFLAVNPAFERLTGLRAKEILGRTVREVLPGIEPVWIERYGRVALTGEPAQFEDFTLVLGRHFEVRAYCPQRGQFAVIFHDITERERAAETLRESEERYRTLVEHSPDAICIQCEGKIVFANSAALCLWGASRPDQVLGRAALDFVHPDFREVVAKRMATIREHRVAVPRREMKYLRLDGSPVDVEVIAVPVVFEGKSAAQYIIHDITERKKAEGSLLAHQRKLRFLASELSLAEERERRRIAVELHDHACQSLALAKMSLESQLEAARPSKRVVRQACHALDETMSGIRSLTFDLSSATLYRFGLEAALEDLLSDKLAGPRLIEYEFRTDREAKPLTTETSVLLFQCVRELLINVVKHAQARKVIVEVRRDGDCIEILVADDGNGFDADAIVSSAYRNRSVGLFFVRERLDYAGGTLRIDTHPGCGSRFTLIAPLDKRAESMKENADGREDSARR